MASKTSKGWCVKSRKLLEAVGNPTRLLILAILLDGEISVNALSEKLGFTYTQSALSQHLGKLRRAGLVDTRPDGHSIYYSCNSSAVRHLFTFLEETFGEVISERRRARAS
ncbi:MULTISPECIES: ArsR/SmtB family transcription factor [unclassified Mesorhizobium]|uniref:ArsR/SmtB family transcription factor n=1 Tax=unclassified Mesorhizobium TaxID=325217 RepID=UPI001CCA6DD4|nr:MULTISPECIES: metalloregulator ArsR/SmtB family transcription factor [unclassified Mesorhizobium]MBZ9739797.1 metalloregulator ArsR/SmtB family transcription factor [Mesorhizobium sp. CO1-1-4]MBZ9804939.1 metalloregulator ArsR/SmtB family transcription factor [Mesorhizobium sp. ES1-6]